MTLLRNGLTKWPHHVLCEKEARELREKKGGNRLRSEKYRASQKNPVSCCIWYRVWVHKCSDRWKNRSFRAIKPAWCCSLHVEEEACVAWVYQTKCCSCTRDQVTFMVNSNSQTNFLLECIPKNSRMNHSTFHVLGCCSVKARQWYTPAVKSQFQRMKNVRHRRTQRKLLIFRLSHLIKSDFTRFGRPSF